MKRPKVQPHGWQGAGLSYFDVLFGETSTVALSSPAFFDPLSE